MVKFKFTSITLLLILITSESQLYHTATKEGERRSYQLLQVETNITSADPTIARVLGQKCDRDNYFNTTNMTSWWENYFNSDSPNPSAPLKAFLEKVPAPTQAQFDNLCFYPNKNNDYAYLYQCSFERQICQCMKEPIHTQAVRLIAGGDPINCLVDANRTCVARQRPKKQDPNKPTGIQEYACIPNYYCDAELSKRCQPCNNTQPHPFCPKPKTNLGLRRMAKVGVGIPVLLITSVSLCLKYI